MNNYNGPHESGKATAGSGGVTSGVPVVVGNELRIPQADAAEGDLYAYLVAGRFNLTKATAAVFVDGADVFYDTVNEETTDDASKLHIGTADGAAGSGVLEHSVRLVPKSAPASGNGMVFDADDSAFVFYIGGSEVARIDATGFVGPAGA